MDFGPPPGLPGLQADDAWITERRPDDQILGPAAAATAAAACIFAPLGTLGVGGGGTGAALKRPGSEDWLAFLEGGGVSCAPVAAVATVAMAVVA